MRIKHQPHGDKIANFGENNQVSDSAIFRNFEPKIYTTWEIGRELSKNLHRRHLTSSQRAACAVQAEAIMARLREEARERQEATQLTGPGVQKQNIYGEGNISTTIKGQTRDQVAALFGTNPRYIQDAQKLKAEAPRIGRGPAAKLDIKK